MTVREGDIVVPRVPISQPLKQECEHFLDSLEGNAAPMSGGAEGVAVVRALDAIARSMSDRGREADVGS